MNTRKIKTLVGFVASTSLCLAALALTTGAAHGQGATGKGKGGFIGKGSGGQGVPTQVNSNAGFDVAEATVLANQLKNLADKGLDALGVGVFNKNKATIVLNAADQKFFTNQFRLVKIRTNVLLNLFKQNGNIKAQALQVAEVLEDQLDDLKDRARDTGNDQLRALVEEMERLSDRLKDAID